MAAYTSMCWKSTGSTAPDRRLAVAREDVVGKREQRVALAAVRERIQAALGALGVLDRALEGALGRAVLLQQPQQLGLAI